MRAVAVPETNRMVETSSCQRLAIGAPRHGKHFLVVTAQDGFAPPRFDRPDAAGLVQACRGQSLAVGGERNIEDAVRVTSKNSFASTVGHIPESDRAIM